MTSILRLKAAASPRLWHISEYLDDSAMTSVFATSLLCGLQASVMLHMIFDTLALTPLDDTPCSPVFAQRWEDIGVRLRWYNGRRAMEFRTMVFFSPEMVTHALGHAFTMTGSFLY